VPAWAGVTASETTWQPQIKWRSGAGAPARGGEPPGTAPRRSEVLCRSETGRPQGLPGPYSGVARKHG